MLTVGIWRECSADHPDAIAQAWRTEDYCPTTGHIRLVTVKVPAHAETAEAWYKSLPATERWQVSGLIARTLEVFGA